VRELLRDRVYVRYWLAVVVSFVGDAMTRITLIYVVARETDSPATIALVVFSQMLPSGALGALVGPLVDRLPTYAVLVTADLVRMGIVLAMIPFLGSVGALLALILAQGVASVFFETARIAAVPRIVGPHSIPTAVALFQSTYQTLQLVGPAVGGLLIAAGSVRVVLAIDAATFVVSAALLGSLAVLRAAPAAAGEREPYWQSLRAGVRGVLAVPSLRLVFAALVPVEVAFGLFTTNVNAQMLTVFDLPASEYGFAQAALAGGAVAATVAGPALMRRVAAPGSLLVWSVGLFGVAMLLLAPTQQLHARVGMAVVLQWCLLGGFFATLYEVPVANTLLGDLPEGLRGRGVGLLHTIGIGFTLVGIALGGLLASTIGVAPSIVATGAALVAVTAAALLPYARTSARAAPADP
jgi:MFS family permease